MFEQQHKEYQTLSRLDHYVMAIEQGYAANPGCMHDGWPPEDVINRAKALMAAVYKEQGDVAT